MEQHYVGKVPFCTNECPGGGERERERERGLKFTFQYNYPMFLSKEKQFFLKGYHIFQQMPQIP